MLQTCLQESASLFRWYSLITTYVPLLIKASQFKTCYCVLPLWDRRTDTCLESRLKSYRESKHALPHRLVTLLPQILLNLRLGLRNNLQNRSWRSSAWQYICPVSFSSNNTMVKGKAAEGSTFLVKVLPSKYNFYQLNTSFQRQLSYAEYCWLII